VVDTFDCPAICPSTMTGTLKPFPSYTLLERGSSCGVESEAEGWSQVLISSTMASYSAIWGIYKKGQALISVSGMVGRGPTTFLFKVEIPLVVNLTT